MKKGWEMKSLGEVLVKTETTDPTKNPSKDFIYVDVSSVNNVTFKIENTTVLNGKSAPSRARKLIRENDVIFATVRPTLKRIAIIPKYLDGQVCSTGYYVLRGQNSVENKYLFYFLQTENFIKQMEKLQKGASYPAVTDNDVKSQSIPLPPLPEQKRIIDTLDKCFTAIDKAKANAEQNYKNAKELFESYLQGVFEEKNFKPQTTRTNTNGWETKTLNQISENLDNKRIPITKNIRESGSIPYYGASGIVDYVVDHIFDDDLLCISEDGANLLARTYPIAFSISGKTWVNNHAHVLKFQNIITQKFVEIYINSIRIDNYVSGMAQPKLNQAMLNKIPIPLPSIKEQQTIVRQLDALRAETQKLEAVYQKKILDLEKLKKSILQKAFTGELTEKRIEYEN